MRGYEAYVMPDTHLRFITNVAVDTSNRESSTAISNIEFIQISRTLLCIIKLKLCAMLAKHQDQLDGI